MPEPRELKAGDACPVCGGKMVPDATQDPARLADAKKRNSPNPAVAKRYEERVHEKAEQEGVIYKCERCGYSARLQGNGGGGGSRESGAGDSGGEGQTNRSSDADTETGAGGRSAGGGAGRHSGTARGR